MGHGIQEPVKLWLAQRIHGEGCSCLKDMVCSESSIQCRQLEAKRDGDEVELLRFWLGSLLWRNGGIREKIVHGEPKG